MKSFDQAAGIALLRTTPGVLTAWLADLANDQAHASEGEGTWSVFDIVGHLLHGERTDWIARAEIILGDGPDRRFAPFDRFAQETTSVGRGLQDLLQDFAAARAANLETLAAWDLSPTNLVRTGEHPAFGEVTLAQLLSTWVAHDQNHLAQIARVLAHPWKDRVGPWQAYLPIVQDETYSAGSKPARRAPQ